MTKWLTLCQHDGIFTWNSNKKNGTKLPGNNASCSHSNQFQQYLDSCAILSKHGVCDSMSHNNYIQEWKVVKQTVTVDTAIYLAEP